ncbi:MAG: pyrroline-5-carboxylate reductase [Bacteroidia bacterium]|nr:pyrroline-5-carboxylate reductase [Bacteroidia bacterium]
MKIAVIGCGNLGKALVCGMIDSGNYLPQNIYATRRNPASLTELKERGVNVLSDNRKAIEQAEIIILAVKPYQILEILSGLSDAIQPEKQLIISVATSISLFDIEGAIGKQLPVFRAMPNTAADIRESITCICQNELGKKHFETVEPIFKSLGSVVNINEELMEAATILGACGIAYVMRFMRAMVQGGIQIGFSAKLANAIVQQTVKGASELLIQNGDHPESEIDKVTTPKGCTIVGLNEMEHNGFSSSLIKGIVASYEKIAQD